MGTAPDVPVRLAGAEGAEPFCKPRIAGRRVLFAAAADQKNCSRQMSPKSWLTTKRAYSTTSFSAQECG